jgi:hypothetical protein
MEIASLFENAAEQARVPAPAPCESLRCRAYYPQQYSLGPLKRCDRIMEQHDGVCWAHKDYYEGWWGRHMPSCGYTEDILMNDNVEEMRFQIEHGYVSLQDPELDAALCTWAGCEQFFMFLCEYDQFNYSAYFAHISVIVYRQTNLVINHQVPYQEAFEVLHRLFDRGYIFSHYLGHALHWVERNVQGIFGPADVVYGILCGTGLTYKDIAGKRQMLADTFRVLRSPYFTEADDIRYNTCMGRFWLWVGQLHDQARAAYEPLRFAVLAAAWAPIRLPFWCLDTEEMAEEYPEGLPSKDEWNVLCTGIEC